MQNNTFYRIYRERRWLIVFALFSILLTSCGNLENIEIGEPKNVKIQGFEDNHLKIFAEIPVSNPSIYKIKVQEIDLRVYLNGSYIGKLIVDEAIEIKGKETKVYELPIKVRLSNILGAAFIMMSLKQGQQVEIRLDGTVKAKSMLVTKELIINETKRIVI